MLHSRVNRPRANQLIDLLRGARAGILLAISVLLLAIAAAMLLKAQVNERSEGIIIANEHRFTALETSLASIQNDLKDLRQYNWIIYVALAGLAGEAGLRIVKRPGRPDSE